MNPKNSIIVAIIIVLLSACSDDDKSFMSGVDIENGIIPKEINDKEFIVYKDSGVKLFSVIKTKDESICIDTKELIDYTKYPPSVSYQTLTNSSAKYILQMTKKTYIPYYNSYHYSTFRFEFTLTFTSTTGGSYECHQINADKSTKDFKGNFTLKSIK